MNCTHCNGYYIWYNELQQRWLVQRGYQVLKGYINRGDAIRYAKTH